MDDSSDGNDYRAIKRRDIRAIATMMGKQLEVYASTRHGGCMLDVVEPDQV
jgi:hypothetical protein